MAIIIAFGVQPYQVESGMGGTILKLTESTHQVIIIDLTSGRNRDNHPSEFLKKEAIRYLTYLEQLVDLAIIN